MTDTRLIAHLDLDSFFVSVERLQNSRLNGLPVIVGGFSDRSVVSSCSYEARKFGVKSGIPVRMAKHLCPDAIIIRGDMDAYSRYSRIVTDIIADQAPVYEKAGIDEHYIDITGIDRFFGAYKWTKSLREKIIKESGLPISFGLSVNKTVAKIATGESKQIGGELFVEKLRVNPFLDPLSISKIPMLGKKSYQSIRLMGVADIRTLRKIPVNMLESLLGKSGKIIWQKANGIDNTPVQTYSERKSIGSETTFEQDSTDIILMNDILSGIVEKLAYKLRKEQWLTSCIVVKIRYADFETHTLQKRIPYTSFDHIIKPVVKDLFAKLYSRRVLIRLIGVRFTGLVRGTVQLDLFEDRPEMINLYLSLDKIKNKYGEKAVFRAVRKKLY
jgi:DNA polymerase IV